MNAVSQRIRDYADTIGALLEHGKDDEAVNVLVRLRDQWKLDSGTAELSELRGEIRKRQSVHDLLSVVSVEQLKTAAQAGFAKWWSRDGINVKYAWFRSCGWQMCGNLTWTDGTTSMLDAHLVNRLYAEAVAPVINPLRALWESVVAPLGAMPQSQDLLDRDLAEARAKLESLPAVDESKLTIINAAGASAAFHCPDTQPKGHYLVSRGWQRLGGEYIFAWPNGAGGRMWGTEAMHKQMSDDYGPFVGIWPNELSRADKGMIRSRLQEAVAV